MHAIRTHTPNDLRILHGANVRRLMAKFDMTLDEVVAATGLDERTLRSLLHGNTRPHARTLHKLATGLGVSTDELFQDPFQSGQFDFDAATNPRVAEVVDQYPEIFAHWTTAEFEELFSRMAVGGELTEEGALAAAQAMNARRELFDQVAVILESHEAGVLRDFIGLLYRRVTEVE